MKISYTISPIQEMTRYPIASRVLTSNLLENEKIEAHFSKSIILTNSIIRNTFRKKMDNIKTTNVPDTLSVFLENIKPKTSPFFVGTVLDEFTDKILNTVPNDYVLVTCFSPYDIYFIKMLLENGKRVVMGGSLVFLGPYPRRMIRDSLKAHGVREEIVENNLIIVNGYVDLYTDIHKIIKEWKDINIENYDISTIWKCNEDYLANPVFEIFTREWNQVCFAFNDKCWWNKCKFCNYCKISQIDYIKDVSNENIIDHIKIMMEKYKAQEIKFIDNYFTFTERAKSLLEQIPYRISIYTGIKYLKNRRFIENVNKYIKMINVGLEAASDFILDAICKGYTYQEVLDACDNIIENLDRKVIVSMMIIMDLPSKNVETIKENYEHLVNIKKLMQENGIKNFEYSAGLLQISPGLDILDGKYAVEHEDFDLSCSGEGFLTKVFNELGIPGHLPYKTNFPYKRYDENGNHLPSDLEIIGAKELDFIINDKDYSTWYEEV